MAYFYILIAATCYTIGSLFLKKSRMHLSDHSTVFEQYLSISFISAILFYTLNIFSFSRALSILPVSVGYPTLASLGLTFLAISSWFFLGEKLKLIQVIGIIVIGFGIILLSSNAS